MGRDPPCPRMVKGTPHMPRSRIALLPGPRPTGVMFTKGRLLHAIVLSGMVALAGCEAPRTNPYQTEGGIIVYDPAPWCDEGEIYAGAPPHLDCVERNSYLDFIRRIE